MISASRMRWIFSFILAAIVLGLGLVGGPWGTSYAAENQVNLALTIVKIQPAIVRVGSPGIVLLITGSGFEVNKNPRVRLTAPGIDVLLAEPLYVLPTAIYQFIPSSYFDDLITYDVYVVQSTPGSIPTIPIDPGYDEVSNSVPLTVTQPMFIPMIMKQ